MGAKRATRSSTIYFLHLATKPNLNNTNVRSDDTAKFERVLESRAHRIIGRSPDPVRKFVRGSITHDTSRQPRRPVIPLSCHHYDHVRSLRFPNLEMFLCLVMWSQCLSSVLF